jgi:arylsulfatase A-like enzyme
MDVGGFVIRATMNRILLVLLFAVIGFFAPSSRAAQPNFVVFVTDDHRADCVRALGNREIRTPNIDRLVRGGTSFTEAHILGARQGAVCVPSRAMLLSGRSLFRAPENLKNVETWPEKLRAAGYDTFISGKWHNGRESLERIFPTGETVFLGGMTDQNAIKVATVSHGHVTNERVERRYSAELFTDSALEFLRARSGSNRFCLYVAFTTPHDPRIAPDEFRKGYDAKKIRPPVNFLPEHPFDNGEMEVRDEKLLPSPRRPEAIRNEWADYYAAITATDAQIGRILDELKRARLEKETIVIFAGDNGLALGSHGLLGKQNLYEHSTRVPLVVAGPGVPKGKSASALVTLNDLAPTICEWANVAATEGSEGRSLMPFFTRRNNTGRPLLFTAYRDVQRAIRDRRWKLIHYPKIDRSQLFDLDYDPHEVHDLSKSAKHIERIERMRSLLEREQKAAGDPMVK